MFRPYELYERYQNLLYHIKFVTTIKLGAFP
jgi:hypothetical protein